MAERKSVYLGLKISLSNWEIPYVCMCIFNNFILNA